MTIGRGRHRPSTVLYRSNDGQAWIIEYDGAVTFFDVGRRDSDGGPCPDCGHVDDVHATRCADGLQVCFGDGCACGLI